MSAPNGQSPAAEKPTDDGGPTPEERTPQGNRISFPTKDAQRRAKLRQEAKRNAEREARIEERRISKELAQFKLEHARIDSTASTQRHDLEQRRQQDDNFARMNADELRVVAYRDHNRLRLWLLPCVYLVVGGIVVGLATGRLAQPQLQTACAATGALIVALLQDRFGLSLRVRLRTQFWSWLRRSLKRRSDRREIESLLTREVHREPPKRPKE
jgi:hypothetical protein